MGLVWSSLAYLTGFVDQIFGMCLKTVCGSARGVEQLSAGQASLWSGALQVCQCGVSSRVHLASLAG